MKMDSVEGATATSEKTPKSSIRVRWRHNQQKTVKDEECPFMFPRVYESSCVSEHEMIPLSYCHDDILEENFNNIVDKFVRVIKLKNKRIHHEEIRRRLQMGEEDAYFKNLLNKDKPGRKPSLHSRLQNGKNLQICFMNDVSDGESPSSDSETCPKLSTRSMNTRRILGQAVSTGNGDDNDFYTYQAKLQIEARMALAQAKDMAHLQMELEKQRTQCPVTTIIQNTMREADVRVAETKRRLSRQILTNLSVRQLRVIVDGFSQHIANLNESLVHILMERDELHMGQDSILVDIEDLTRYLAAKEQPRNSNSIMSTSTKPTTILKRDDEQSVKNNNNNMPNKFFKLSSFARH